MPRLTKTQPHIRSDAHRRASPADGSFLGQPSDNPLDLIDRIQKGLPYQALADLQQQTGLSAERLARAIRLSPRTLTRRKDRGQLGPVESDRLVRLAQLFRQAVKLFEGDVEAARDWFTKPALALGEQSPLTMVETEVGAREVEALIGRLEYGVYT